MELRLVSEPIDDYCRVHSTLPSPDCDALFEYTQVNVPMSVMLTGPQVGSFLGLLIHAVRAKRILEVGTYTGYSALVMAERLPADGELVTLDLNEETLKIARSFWDKSPHGKKIRSLAGDAGKTLAELRGPFDFVFIDADKGSYVKYLERALELLSENGLIVADNCLWSGRVVDSANQEIDTRAIRAFNDYVAGRPDLESSLIPLRDGLFLIRKKPRA